MNWGELDGWINPISSLFYYYNIYGIAHKSPYTNLLHNTFAQAGAYTSYIPSLLQMNCTRDLPSDLVNKFAS